MSLQGEFRFLYFGQEVCVDLANAMLLNRAMSTRSHYRFDSFAFPELWFEATALGDERYRLTGRGVTPDCYSVMCENKVVFVGSNFVITLVLA